MKTTVAFAGDTRTGGTVGDDEDGVSGLRPDAWDPREVWLTRIKQPRDRRYDTVAPGQRATVVTGDAPGCEASTGCRAGDSASGSPRVGAAYRS